MNDQRDLEGLGVLVTGATSGIGKAAAEELGRHGAEIIVHGRDAGRGSAVAGTITAAGGKARFVAADLTDPAQVDHLVDQAGAVDVLVNNAGFSWFGPTAELDVATFDRLFAANVRAPYFLVAVLAPKMAAGAAEASSTSPAWPARSAWRAAPPTAPPRPPWRQ
jgi:NAD(P)-dependent dehydrogenase (short-subunit alcohol dehydrogenase family)